MVLKGVLFQVLLTPWKMRITWLAHVSGSPMYLARPCIWLAHVSGSPLYLARPYSSFPSRFLSFPRKQTSIGSSQGSPAGLPAPPLASWPPPFPPR